MGSGAVDGDAFAALADAQEGVLSRRALASVGYGYRRVAAEVRVRRWRLWGTRAVILHRGTPTRRQRWWAAVLNAGPRAALTGLTAAEEQGLTGFEAGSVHVVVPSNAWVPRQPDGVVVHVSRRFSQDDLHPGRSIPSVRFERALVDAAAFTGNPRRASAILIAAVQQRRTRPERLREVLRTQGRIRHRALLLAVLNDVEGGVHALSELDFARLCRRYRMPKPTRQRKRVDADGRTRWLDARFELRDGRVLNVEVDGAAHLHVLDAWADAERDIALLLQGESTVRVPAVLLRTAPDTVAARLRPLLLPS